jgi:Protein of unknown function (DUF3096)
MPGERIFRVRRLSRETKAREPAATAPRSSVSPSTSASAPMTIDVVFLQPLIALIAGILILVVPRVLNYVVALYLIVVGVTGLWAHVAIH